jgi:hypothetical protein
MKIIKVIVPLIIINNDRIPLSSFSEQIQNTDTCDVEHKMLYNNLASFLKQRF